MRLMAYSGLAALLTALLSNPYPAGSDGLAVAPPHAHGLHKIDDRPGGVGPVEAGPQPAPASPDQMRPMDQTPARPVDPDRAAYEQRTSAELSGWERRLRNYTAQARKGDGKQRGQADKLTRQLTQVKQQWENLRQTTDANWDTQKVHLEHSLARFKRDWHSATGQ